MTPRAESEIRTGVLRAGFYGWWLLAAFWLMLFFNLGFPAYGQAVLNHAMAKELGFDRQTLGFIFSIYIAMSGVPGPLVAVSINRIGIRRTLILGSVFLIVGASLMAAWVSAAWQAVVALGIIVGAGVVTGASLASQTGVARWFVRRRALALAVLYSAGAFGGAVASWLLNRVIDLAGGNWRAGWWVMAALSATALLIAAFAVKEKPADLGQQPDGETGAAATNGVAAVRRASFITTGSWTYRETLSTPAYWIVVLAFVPGSCGFSLILSQGISYLVDLGHDRGTAAETIGVMTLSGLVAKIFVALIGDRSDPRFLWAVFTAAFGVGLALFVDARTVPLMIAAAVGAGIGFGGGIVCLMAVLSNYFGTSVFASVSGLAIAINTGSSVVAPIVGGWLYDRGYGYRGTLYVLAAWCLIAAVSLALIKPPRKSSN